MGMLMSYYPMYTVVKSTAFGIAQHDPLTWKVIGSKFETVEEIDSSARTISDTLHELLKQTDKEERARAVDALFGILENTRVSSFSEMKEEWFRSITGVAQATRDLPQDSCKTVTKLVGLFLSQGFDNLAEKYRARMQERRPERKETEQESGSNGANAEGHGTETSNEGLTGDSME